MIFYRNGNRRPTTRRRRKKASPFKVNMNDDIHLFNFWYWDDHSLASVPRLHSLRHYLLPAPRLPWPRLQQQELQRACSLLWSLWVSPEFTSQLITSLRVQIIPPGDVSEYLSWPPSESGSLSLTSSAEILRAGWEVGLSYLHVTVQTQDRPPLITISTRLMMHQVT